jgi:hypothetical protein
MVEYVKNVNIRYVMMTFQCYSRVFPGGTCLYLDAKLGISGYVYDWSCRYISCDHMVKNIIYQPVLAWVVYLIMAY